MVRVPVSRDGEPGGGSVMLLARADAHLDAHRLLDIAMRREVVRKAQGRGTKDTPRYAESIVGRITVAANSGEQVRTSLLSRDHALELVDDLAVVIPKLRNLEKRLRLRATVSDGVVRLDAS